MEDHTQIKARRTAEEKKLKKSKEEVFWKMGKGKTFFLAILIFAVLSLLSGCEENKREPSAKEKEEPLLLEAQGVSLVGWDEEGRKSWELQADSGRQFVNRMVLLRVKVKLLEEGKLASGGEAGKVVVDIRTSNLLFEGKVKLISYVNEAELFTSNLEWIASEKKLRTEERVLFERGDLITEGWGLIADPELGQIEIKREVVTRLRF
ncbi:LPS export ABC transporter periplasmic protein LptC [Candidatus Aerophobetes bacterium]|uniref:LPS export ABC transporter periplasmic protein LptC n=1 Tax=Aerophobetes bacterium TaxID=2030807 RepID=A0A523QHZ1_UNCAE|nr:MAG: LPS export ABC transporter periplasmic protein LptC [Candidatus Aerophobetes bacterium]